jgi:chlorobactene glucosyltransferase
VLASVFFSLLPCFLLAGVAYWNARGAPRLHHFKTPAGVTGPLPWVSVLIPARNEEYHLATCLDALKKCTYPCLEVIVGDDESEDRTPEILSAYQSLMGARLKTLRSHHGPPRGWTGKAWMCHQLAAQARGEILIFCDADVRVEPSAIGETVHALMSEDADALSALPLQTGQSTFCRALVALISQVLILVALPLPLITRGPAALSAGNGQWFAWRRKAYQRVGGHAAVSSSCLEDVTMARNAKLQGLRLVLAAAPRSLQVCMYKNLTASIKGFEKNLFALLGGSSLGIILMILFGGLWIFCTIEILVAYPTFFVFFAWWIVILGWAQKKVFETPLPVICLIPFSLPIAVVILARSWWGNLRGTITWKDRLLPLQQSVDRR